jgi:hypothetical protein
MCIRCLSLSAVLTVKIVFIRYVHMSHTYSTEFKFYMLLFLTAQTNYLFEKYRCNKMYFY